MVVWNRCKPQEQRKGIIMDVKTESRIAGFLLSIVDVLYILVVTRDVKRSTPEVTQRIEDLLPEGQSMTAEQTHRRMRKYERHGLIKVSTKKDGGIPHWTLSSAGSEILRSIRAAYFANPLVSPKKQKKVYFLHERTRTPWLHVLMIGLLRESIDRETLLLRVQVIAGYRPKRDTFRAAWLKLQSDGFLSFEDNLFTLTKEGELLREKLSDVLNVKKLEARFRKGDGEGANWTPIEEAIEELEAELTEAKRLEEEIAKAEQVKSAPRAKPRSRSPQECSQGDILVRRRRLINRCTELLPVQMLLTVPSVSSKEELFEKLDWTSVGGDPEDVKVMLDEAWELLHEKCLWCSFPFGPNPGAVVAEAKTLIRCLSGALHKNIYQMREENTAFPHVGCLELVIGILGEKRRMKLSKIVRYIEQLTGETVPADWIKQRLNIPECRRVLNIEKYVADPVISLQKGLQTLLFGLKFQLHCDEPEEGSEFPSLLRRVTDARERTPGNGKPPKEDSPPEAPVATVSQANEPAEAEATTKELPEIEDLEGIVFRRIGTDGASATQIATTINFENIAEFKPVGDDEVQNILVALWARQQKVKPKYEGGTVTKTTVFVLSQ